jgi:serine/threonine-protein kinase
MLGGGLKTASDVEFDQVGDHWVSVTIDSRTCQNNVSEIWQVFTLAPAPDGTLTGEYSATVANDCAEKRTVTFSRTGDVDLSSLPDPATLSARVVSPAEALHRRYHSKLVFKAGLAPQDADELVTTNCTHRREVHELFLPTYEGHTLVFDGGKWMLYEEYPATFQGCNNLNLITHGEYPMPQPPQNPITLLKGHGHHQQSGNCLISVDFDETLTRTGD